MHKDFSNDFSIEYDEGKRSCSLRFRCFDTPNSVTVFGVAQPDYAMEELLQAVRRACLRLHALWSFSLEGSDVALLNEPVAHVKVHEETARLIQCMKEFNGVEPAFDFTVGAVSFLWKKARRLPEERELARALANVGAGKVSVVGPDGGEACGRARGGAHETIPGALDVAMVSGITCDRMGETAAGAWEVVKAREGVRVDVGGAAKGYAADMVADMLRKAGVKSADVDLGGNLYMIGSHPTGRPWRVSVRIPEGVNADPVIVEVVDKSVVTSGGYERFTEIGGKRFTHIIDARTGWPVESDLASATVVAESSLQADMLATTAVMLGSTGLPGLSERHPGCEFIAIRQSGEVLTAVHSPTAATCYNRTR